MLNSLFTFLRKNLVIKIKQMFFEIDYKKSVELNKTKFGIHTILNIKFDNIYIIYIYIQRERETYQNCNEKAY